MLARSLASGVYSVVKTGVLPQRADCHQDRPYHSQVAPSGSTPLSVYPPVLAVLMQPHSTVCLIIPEVSLRSLPGYTRLPVCVPTPSCALLFNRSPRREEHTSAGRREENAKAAMPLVSGG